MEGGADKDNEVSKADSLYHFLNGFLLPKLSISGEEEDKFITELGQQLARPPYSLDFVYIAMRSGSKAMRAHIHRAARNITASQLHLAES